MLSHTSVTLTVMGKTVVVEPGSKTGRDWEHDDIADMVVISIDGTDVEDQDTLDETFMSKLIDDLSSEMASENIGRAEYEGDAAQDR